MINTHAAIAALEALSADTLKQDDKLTFDQLRDAAERVMELIAEEVERRYPTPEFDIDIDVEAMIDRAERAREERKRRAAEQQERHLARWATIREAIECCATNPDLYERTKALFPAALSEPG